MMEEKMEFRVEEKDAGTRIDKYVSGLLEGKSRSYIQGMIEKGGVLVNGNIKKSNYPVREGDVICVTIPEPEAMNVKPEKIPLEILYEDSDLVVVNKKQGMVVHPASGVYSGTLVNALLEHCTDLSGINGVLRPGIVHRIDKDTSGILVIAKNDNAHNILAHQLKEHTMTRVYYALVEGVIKQDEGVVDTQIGRHPAEKIKMAVVREGRRAVTHYRVVKRYRAHTLVECVLETGRTHQIRVHMAHIGHPVVGDPVYGHKKQRFKLEGQLLHAKKLGFIHPSRNEYVEFESPLPDYFVKVLGILENELKKC
ncbi:MAG: pseudouridine synthase [Firmicutes bacterium]|nr:pseudouridine synthase [Bacillota bacterium]